MGWYKAWRKKQLDDQIFRLVIGEISNQLAAGVPLEDIWKPCIYKPIEWDILEQCWKVQYGGELAIGKLIEIVSGRGGAEEYARIERCLDPEEGWYAVTFDGMTASLDVVDADTDTSSSNEGEEEEKK